MKEQLYTSIVQYLHRSSGKTRSLPWGGIAVALTPPNKQQQQKHGEQAPGQLSSFARQWIPFVDQLVCAKARAVVGTSSSTFTDYIERLYVHYWSPRMTATTKATTDYQNTQYLFAIV